MPPPLALLLFKLGEHKMRVELGSQVMRVPGAARAARAASALMAIPDIEEKSGLYWGVVFVEVVMGEVVC